MIERRNQSPEGRLRRLQEKNIFNCDKCYPRLCTCEDRHEHGIRRDGKRTNEALHEEV
jgi:hypothetical protein